MRGVLAVVGVGLVLPGCGALVLAIGIVSWDPLQTIFLLTGVALPLILASMYLAVIRDEKLQRLDRRFQRLTVLSLGVSLPFVPGEILSYPTGFLWSVVPGYLLMLAPGLAAVCIVVLAARSNAGRADDESLSGGTGVKRRNFRRLRDFPRCGAAASCSLFGITPNRRRRAFAPRKLSVYQRGFPHAYRRARPRRDLQDPCPR